MNKLRVYFLLAAILLPAVAGRAQTFNRAPLEPSPYAELPLGAVKARGWLQEQLRRQADGLTGHLDEVYPEVMGPSNAWLGGDGDAWERGPYWIDGLLPLAWILDDETLKAKASAWVEAILSSQRPDGALGPAEDHPYVYGLQRGKSQDWWPRMVALKVLQQYYSATGDTRVIDCLKAYFAYQLHSLPDKPLDHWSDWGAWRGADNLQMVYWLYNLTGEPWLLELGELIHSQTKDWTGMFADGGIFTHQNDIHCVNLAQGFKAPHVWWQYSHNTADLQAPGRAVETIRNTVGLPTGLWAGDELLHFGAPTRGSELCTAVEMMYSLETMLCISGDVQWADYLERVAYNALPAQTDPEFRFKQYYQQANQVSCVRDARAFSTPHYGTDVLFGTLNGYPCCLSNMHQGWPKLTRNLWYATPDGGLAAMVYAPSQVSATVAGGVRVTIEETTDYPFRESVSFRIVGFDRCKPCGASFPLSLRIPEWCGAPVLLVNGSEVPLAQERGVVRIERKWKKGDTVELRLPMQLQTEEWYDRAWTFVRGPLVYALKMNEKWEWKSFGGSDRWFGEGAWEVTSDSPWNFCIMRDSFSTGACSIVESAADTAYPWTSASAPVSIFVPARSLPGWTVPDSVAFFTEDGFDVGSEAEIELIPYGCTTLRISEFPTRIIPWDLELRK